MFPEPNLCQHILRIEDKQANFRRNLVFHLTSIDPFPFLSQFPLDKVLLNSVNKYFGDMVAPPYVAAD